MMIPLQGVFILICAFYISVCFAASLPVLSLESVNEENTEGSWKSNNQEIKGLSGRAIVPVKPATRPYPKSEGRGSSSSNGTSGLKSTPIWYCCTVLLCLLVIGKAF